ncbi:PhoU-like phosphate uptake regulator [Pseudonocardia sediminis]|uniref:PhoU-like phosphate uptake regulator n=1 Tax=Pseudonocardia sediminis TaxID=1397368 RepID=A0A4V2FQ70_PSEST|nr:PhoU domain-containing protein [Pseudonocardia sediminis]RZT83650.1 PhoU-like phosphate uptake regulator [Pseudonocardia sediminis]
MRRETLDDNLAQIQRLLDEMGPEVAVAFRRASTALLEGRGRLAEQVVSHDPVIDDLRSRIELLAVETINIHAPVVGPLRSCVTAIQAAHHLERMGDLARHIAETAARHAPEPAVPEQARPLFQEYGGLVSAMGDKAVTVLTSRNVVLATELGTDDARVNDLHRDVFTLMFGDTWTEGVPAAVDTALLARFHERYADQAKSLAQRVIYAVTGQEPSTLSI